MGRRGSEPGLWQSCGCAPVQQQASSIILAKFSHSDPSLSMLQITKEKHLGVQLTELYKMRPEPKKVHTIQPLVYISSCALIQSRHRSVSCCSNFSDFGDMVSYHKTQLFIARYDYSNLNSIILNKIELGLKKQRAHCTADG